MSDKTLAAMRFVSRQSLTKVIAGVLLVGGAISGVACGSSGSGATKAQPSQNADSDGSVIGGTNGAAIAGPSDGGTASTASSNGSTGTGGSAGANGGGGAAGGSAGATVATGTADSGVQQRNDAGATASSSSDAGTNAPQLTIAGTDRDGNVYHGVVIGTQTWMVENLKTTKFNDGTPIPMVADTGAWLQATTAAYCWADNNEAMNKPRYGALYNFYAAAKANLCPEGWHVASKDDWAALLKYAAATYVPHWGWALRSRDGWSDRNGTNLSGFSWMAVPYRQGGGGGGQFTGAGIITFIGSGSEKAETNQWWAYQINHDWADFVRTQGTGKNSGFPIRCIR